MPLPALAVAGLGALAGGMLGNNQKPGVQTNNPPDYLLPYLQQIAQAAQAQFFGGSVFPTMPSSTPQQTGAVGQSYTPGITNRGWGGYVGPLSDTGQPLTSSQRVGTLNISPMVQRIDGNSPAASAPFGTGGTQSGVTFNQPQYYPGSTVVPFAPETNMALNLTSQRALAGSPLTQQAGDYLGSLYGAQNPADQYLMQTAQGDYLNGPGLDRAFQAASNRIIPQVNSLFARGGRSGSGLAQTAMTSALGDSFASLYDAERNRQMGALGQLSSNFGQRGSLGLSAAALAPTIAGQDYADFGQLANVGAQREALAQQQMQDSIDRFYFNQNAPSNQLAQYAALINGQAGLGFGQQIMQQPRASTAQNMLGGGLLGYGLANGGFF